MPKKTIDIHKVHIANLPTPLYKLERLSELWDTDLYVKRDDLTESAITGNKCRKLEYLIGHAMSKKADTIITCGGRQSNHCRATALAAGRFGLDCHLLLRGDPPSASLDGNLLLDRIAGAECHFIPAQDYYDDLAGHLSSIATAVTQNGGSPYIVTEGGSDEVGSLGYVDVIPELMEQCRHQGVRPRRLVCATGSGGTHAGLFIGTKLYGWDVEVVSMGVCYNPQETVHRISAIVNRMIDLYKLPIQFRNSEIRVIDRVGDGYAQAGNQEFETITTVARNEGLLLDPVYTGKAMGGLLANPVDGATIFIHTGGVFGLFPFRDQITEFLKGESETD